MSERVFRCLQRDQLPSYHWDPLGAVGPVFHSPDGVMDRGRTIEGLQGAAVA